MRHVYMHCNMGSDVITPVELVDALNANGGVSNTVAELVDINKPTVEHFEQENLEIIGKLQNIGDHMEVQFDSMRNSASVYENLNLPLIATDNLINVTTNDINKGNCENESDEYCASNENRHC
ncbi:Hypothetical predicted protein [Octopus vulgaris]|uniref:Uncharacterized protein n=1 Tax=Octopus vulgaris TaxID=6645 RepID=A0AA36EY68_OCTVU|nr:Hypothetical predicted protein [Octopus vulgaris]